VKDHKEDNIEIIVECKKANRLRILEKYLDYEKKGNLTYEFTNWFCQYRRR